MKLNPQKTALTAGVFAGLWHFIWGILVAAGLAGTLIDFIYSIHFLNNPFTIQPFNFVKWITLVVVTTAIGYVAGYIFATVWNRVNK